MALNFGSFYEKFLNRFSNNLQDWIKITVEISIVLITYVVLHNGLFWVTLLPFDAYYSDFIYLAFLKRILNNPYLLIIVLFFLVFFNKKLLIKWRSFGNDHFTRRFIFVVTLTLTWFFATYGTNFYFNELHYADRVLLIALGFLVYWRPIFLLPFMTVLLAIFGQFEWLPVFSVAAPPFLLIKILILFISFYIIKLITKSFSPTTFIFMVGCLIATHYFVPGYGKFNLYWAFNNKINYLVPSAYSGGWLYFLSESTISNITEFLGWFNIPLRLFTITVECGMLFFFAHLKWARFLIFSAIFMHLGIFGYSGILFWMWIIVLISSTFIFSKKTHHLDKVFKKQYVVISIFLILGGKFWCHARSLAWCDVPYSYTYKFYGETEDGTQHRLSPNFFSHYDFQFTVGAFKFWQNQPRLPIVWGTSTATTSDYFNTERSVEDILEYEKTNGVLHKNDALQKKYEDFIVQYITNWNKKPGASNYFEPIQALPFYWIFSPSGINDGKQKIKRVIIVESTTFYSKKTGYKEIRNQEIRQLDIP